MKKLALMIAAAIIIITSLSGCVGMGGNEAYSAAHKAAADSRTAESNNRAKVESDRALAVASIAKSCKDDVCRAVGFMTLQQQGGASQAAMATPAPVIAAPVDPAVQIIEKIIDKGADLVNAKFGLDLGLANMSRSPADKDLLMQINRSNTIETRSSINATTTTAK